MSGRLSTLFNVETYQAYLRDLHGLTMPRNWSYPPSFILFLLPLAILPYAMSYSVWVIAGLTVFAGASLKSIRQAAANLRRHALLLALAPASLINAFFGQNGFITGVLLYLGVRLASSRPVLSGICIGLLTIKPQLGLLIPFMLILTRNWTAIASATVTAMALFLLSGLFFGWQAWIDYVELAVPFQRYVMEEWSGLFLKMMPSAYAVGRQFGLDPTLCLLLQAPMTILAIGLTIWLYAKPRHNREATELLFLLCVFMATPYSFNYDMTALMPALLIYWSSKTHTGDLNWQHVALVGGLYLLPAIIFIAPIGPVAMLAACWVLVRGVSSGPARI
ncbi:MAG: glycosyltransferase family 87 protein [Pseudomonadota bacterium]